MKAKKQQLELNMEQLTGSKLRKEYVKAMPCFFSFYADYIYEMLGWMNHKLESRLLGEISTMSDAQMIPL